MLIYLSKKDSSKIESSGVASGPSPLCYIILALVFKSQSL